MFEVKSSPWSSLEFKSFKTDAFLLLVSVVTDMGISTRDAEVLGVGWTFTSFAVGVFGVKGKFSSANNKITKKLKIITSAGS